MKSYRFLVLGLLVLLVGSGWLSLARAGAEVEKAYAQHLGAARVAVEIGAIQEAQAEYRAALALKPDLDVNLELVAFLAADAPRDVYVEELTQLVSAYPERPEGYELLALAYEDDADVAGAYETVTGARAREVRSDELDAIYARVAYGYTTGLQHFADVLPYGRSDIAAVRDEEGRWIHVDAAGMSLNGRYEAVGPMWAGNRFVVDDGLPQFVDEKGRQTLAATRAGYEEYGILTDGVFAARLPSGAWTFLDRAFRPVLGDQTFTEVTSFAGGLAGVRDGDTWRVVRPDGAVVGEGYGAVAVDEARVLVAQGRYLAKVGSEFQLFDTDGDRVGDGAYEDARPFDEDGAAAVRIAGRWGFIDTSGKVVVEPAFEDARSFAHGLAPVRIGGAWGYVDPEGAVVIPPTFLDATRFSAEGSALVLTQAAPRHAALTDSTTPAAAPPAPGAPSSPDADAPAPPADAPTSGGTPTEPSDQTTTPGALPGGDVGWYQIKLQRY